MPKEYCNLKTKQGLQKHFFLMHEQFSFLSLWDVYEFSTFIILLFSPFLLSSLMYACECDCAC